MPRYFFHIRTDEELILDEEGAEFEDLETAKTEAAQSCRDLAAEELRRSGSVTFYKIEVGDENGKVLHISQGWQVFG